MIIYFFLKEKKKMKKRRTLIISLLLVAALALGIGYAATSNEVQINGTIENSPVNVQLKFLKSSLEADSLTASRIPVIKEASDAGQPGTATISISAAGLKEKGDSVTFTFVLHNESNIDVKLSALKFYEGSTEVADMDSQDKINTHFAPYTFELTGWDDGTVVTANDNADGGTDEITITLKITLNEWKDTQAIHNFILKATAIPANYQQ